MIYHITTNEAWSHAIQDGNYKPASLRTEGFIHCSPWEEIIDTARLWFQGQDNLLVLSICPEKIPWEVRYETAPGRSSLMPHIYGPLPVNAVTRIFDLKQGPDGAFTLQQDS